MSNYDAIFDKAVVINTLKGEDIFAVIAELVDGLVDAGVLPEEKREEAKQAVVRREMSASTVLPGEIALPHGRTDVVD